MIVIKVSGKGRPCIPESLKMHDTEYNMFEQYIKTQYTKWKMYN